MTESTTDTTATWPQFFSNTAAAHDAFLKIVYSPSGLLKLPQSDRRNGEASLPFAATLEGNESIQSSA